MASKAADGRTIAILNPGDLFTGGFYDSLLATIGTFFGKYNLVFYREYSSDIYNCREALVQKLKNTRYDWAVWIDSDMTWKPEDIERLIHTEGYDVVSGVCMIDMYRANCATFKDDEDAIGYLNAWRIQELGEVIDVDLVGLGFVAMRAGVLESVPEPVFRSGYIVRDGRNILASEDFLLSHRLKQMGYRIGVRTDVVVGHQKRVTLRPEVIDGRRG